MQETKPKTNGYNGYFPQDKNPILKFHNESYGIINGIASINVYIENGEYKGYTVSINKEGVLHAD
jgi:hypothetical protein